MPGRTLLNLLVLVAVLVTALPRRAEGQGSCPPPGWAPPASGPNNFYVVYCLPGGGTPPPYGTVPPVPPDAFVKDDRTFRSEPNPASGEECRDPRQGEAVSINIPIDRYVGEVNSFQGLSIGTSEDGAQLVYVCEYLSMKTRHHAPSLHRFEFILTAIGCRTSGD